jgi:hypothetical protein
VAPSACELEVSQSTCVRDSALKQFAAACLAPVTGSNIGPLSRCNVGSRSERKSTTAHFEDWPKASVQLGCFASLSLDGRTGHAGVLGEAVKSAGPRLECSFWQPRSSEIYILA